MQNVSSTMTRVKPVASSMWSLVFTERFNRKWKWNLCWHLIVVSISFIHFEVYKHEEHIKLIIVVVIIIIFVFVFSQLKTNVVNICIDDGDEVLNEFILGNIFGRKVSISYPGLFSSTVYRSQVPIEQLRQLGKVFCATRVSKHLMFASPDLNSGALMTSLDTSCPIKLLIMKIIDLCP